MPNLVPPPVVPYYQGVGYQMFGNDKYGDCLGPGTRVLTADLRWVPVESLKVGDKLVGFDEFAGPTGRRRYRTSTVEKVVGLVKPCYDLEMQDGTVIRASADHLWLRSHNADGGWLATEKLTAHGARSSKLAKVVNPWDDLDDYDRGYLAGAFDGEGCFTLSNIGHLKALTFAQRDNTMLTEVERFLTALYVPFRREHVARSSLSEKGYEKLLIEGGRWQSARLLGLVRPKRLLEKFSPEVLGYADIRHNLIPVVQKKDVGQQWVIAVQTSTRTLIAEGYATHNCTCAGAGNLTLTWAHEMGLQESTDTQSVEAMYWAITGGKDTGAMEQTVLHYWQQTGLGLLAPAGPDKIVTFAPVAENLKGDVLKSTWLFGGTYLGVIMPESAMAQFNHGQPWDLTSGGENILGGHCVVLVGYDQTYLYVATWGQVQKMTWRWWLRWGEEAWAIIPQEFAKIGHGVTGADLTTLGQVIEDLAGDTADYWGKG